MVDILIISDETDVHARAILAQLRSLGEQAMIWQPADLLERGTLQADISETVHLGYTGADRLDLTQVKSVWLRRTKPVKPPPAPDWVEEFVRNESTSALEGLWEFMDCFWVNPPCAQRAALFKLRQLSAAKKCGLKIPESLITNSPQAAEEFALQHANVIYKLIDERSQQYLRLHRNTSGVPTLPLLQSDLPALDSVSRCIHLFQRRIDKRYDVRAVVLGEDVRAVRINSQEGRGKIDFRLDYSVAITPYELPEAVSAKCVAVTKDLGLVFGCIDLAVDQDGQYVFFEVNPQGQFLWMEEQAVQITRLLAAALARGRFEKSR